MKISHWKAGISGLALCLLLFAGLAAPSPAAGSATIIEFRSQT